MHVYTCFRSIYRVHTKTPYHTLALPVHQTGSGPQKAGSALCQHPVRPCAFRSTKVPHGHQIWSPHPRSAAHSAHSVRTVPIPVPSAGGTPQGSQATHSPYIIQENILLAIRKGILRLNDFSCWKSRVICDQRSIILYCFFPVTGSNLCLKRNTKANVCPV